MRNLKKLCVTLVLASFLIFTVAGTAMAAPNKKTVDDDDEEEESGMTTNLYKSLDKFVDKLPAESREGVRWAIKMVMYVVIIFTSLSILSSQLERQNARRNGSIGGEAYAEHKSEQKTKNFLLSVGLAFVVIIVSNMFII
jgi:uncharacterized membrane protein